MSRHLGARLRLGHAVANVAERDGQVELTALTADGARGFRADRAIVAAPQFVSERIVAPLRGGSRSRAARERGAWAVANLYLRDRPKLRSGDAPLAWDNVLYDSKSLGYVVATHQLGKDHGPTVLTWYYPFTGDGARARRELDSARREDWAAAALADISRAHPDVAALCERIDVAYWGHGMVRPRPGSVFDPALAAARAPLGSIHFAGSELSGMSLFEEAFDHGVRAAEEVLGAQGRRT
jgi:monoamine oxidase